ncbi:cation:proton antiporter regulatory subunit [Pilimelia columellifera]|uniref:Cation:proton antiporter regulatory subunit n=1 Tax=Pilimelia columellifera subsp. columellifera TaxID=706583 RepID=A0ABP6B2V6_9ACTN
MDLERTSLLGVGLSYAFTTENGQRGGVVARTDGERELVLYDPADPESSVGTLTLTAEEARTVAELLDLPVTIDHVVELERQLKGVEVIRFPIAADSPYVGRTIGDSRARTRTGAFIIAVGRDGQVLPSPGPEFRFEAGDTAVAVGQAAGLDALRELLARDG